MDAFILQIELYHGKPTEVTHEGLFDKIAEVLSGNEIGLVNK